MGNNARIILFFVFSSVLFSCASKKAYHPYTILELMGDCPKGTCTIKLLKNKSLEIRQDESGIHYSVEANAEKDVVVFNYSKTVKGNIQDASYREEIVFEIGADLKALNLSDGALQNTNMLFGRFCYCKGQTGYYKVVKGKMNAATATAKNEIMLDFAISEVPQIINEIHFSVK